MGSRKKRAEGRGGGVVRCGAQGLHPVVSAHDVSAFRQEPAGPDLARRNAGASPAVRRDDRDFWMVEVSGDDGRDCRSGAPWPACVLLVCGAGVVAALLGFWLGLHAEEAKQKRTERIAFEAAYRAEQAGWKLHEANDAAIVWRQQADKCIRKK